MTPILALDLGCKTGWALDTEVTGVVGGTWRLDRPVATTILDDAGDSPFIRDWRLFWLISGIIDSPYFGDGVIAYEDVQFSVSTLQTQQWSGYRSTVLHAARFSGISRFITAPVGTLKKFASGHGAATKEMMASSYARQNRGASLDAKGRVVNSLGKLLDDNAVDARHLLNFARKQYSA